MSQGSHGATGRGGMRDEQSELKLCSKYMYQGGVAHVKKDLSAYETFDSKQESGNDVRDSAVASGRGPLTA